MWMQGRDGRFRKEELVMREIFVVVVVVDKVHQKGFHYYGLILFKILPEHTNTTEIHNYKTRGGYVTQLIIIKLP